MYSLGTSSLLVPDGDVDVLLAFSALAAFRLKLFLGSCQRGGSHPIQRYTAAYVALVQVSSLQFQRYRKCKEVFGRVLECTRHSTPVSLRPVTSTIHLLERYVLWISSKFSRKSAFSEWQSFVYAQARSRRRWSTYLKQIMPIHPTYLHFLCNGMKYALYSYYYFLLFITFRHVFF